MTGDGTDHRNTGVGKWTRTYCPDAGEWFGPHPEAFALSPYCPYCGGPVEDDEHRLHDDGNEVDCSNTGQSTFRFCPYCSERTERKSTATDRDDELATDGGLVEPTLYEVDSDNLADHLIAECPGCLDALLLGDIWRELILEDGHEVPKCPDCEPEEWSDDAEPKLDGVELWALQGDRIDPDAGGSAA